MARDYLETRREFLKKSVIGGATFYFLPIVGCHEEEPIPPTQVLDSSWPHVCRIPVSEEDFVALAIAEAIVPGFKHGAGPGAVDLCALDLITDPTLPVHKIMPLLAFIMNLQSWIRYGKPFPDLDLDPRYRVLQETQKDFPIVVQAYRFIRSAFYSDYKGLEGMQWLGYPGPKLSGYTADPDYSVGKPPGLIEIASQGSLP